MASSDSASSPIAIASPAPIQSTGSSCPVLAPRASPASQLQHENPGIITQKEWIVPPRPKPGRKPATDTPPTKRKAQNRAAQRAFRERRAARVNELEDKLKEAATDTAIKDQEYRDQIQQLTRNNSELAKENTQCKLRLEALQKELEALQRPKAEVTQVASPAPSSGTADAPCRKDCTCRDIIDKALCDRHDTATMATIVPLPKRDRSPTESQGLIGCGSCSKDGECACYNTATAVSVPAPSVPLPKRSKSPITNSSKRTRIVGNLDELETDFTTAYMSRPTPLSRSTSSIIHIHDPCGFCSDGTPCVCAEMANAMNMEDSDTDEGRRNVKLAPILSGGDGMLSPPDSSAGDSVPLRRMVGLGKPLGLYPPAGVRVPPNPMSSAESTAGTGPGCKPGGCDQCKSDPMSTLFCQSIAARESGAADSGCCGGNAGGSGCCKDIGPTTLPLPKRTRAQQKAKDEKTYIPCSAAYQTLSRHRAFDQATADLGSLVRPLVIQTLGGGCPKVEVSSVRDVLKMLDRKFGRD